MHVLWGLTIHLMYTLAVQCYKGKYVDSDNHVTVNIRFHSIQYLSYDFVNLNFMENYHKKIY